MIDVVRVKDRNEGNFRAHDILQEVTDSDALLALSGGTSPDYQKMIVEPADISPRCVCLVDERYGPVYHKNSNELLIKKSGLFDYLNKNDIEYHRILEDEDFAQSVADYNKLMDELFERFEKRVGVMGVGVNLHTAGIFPHSEALVSNDCVIGEEVKDQFPKRITLTIKALEEFQAFVILVFGEGKREALKIMLDEEEVNLAKYPAVFYRKSAANSYLITDIKV